MILNATDPNFTSVKMKIVSPIVVKSDCYTASVKSKRKDLEIGSESSAKCVRDEMKNFTRNKSKIKSFTSNIRKMKSKSDKNGGKWMLCNVRRGKKFSHHRTTNNNNYILTRTNNFILPRDCALIRTLTSCFCCKVPHQ